MIHPAKKPMEGGFSLDKFLSGISKEDAEALGDMFDEMEAEKRLNGWIPCSQSKPKIEEKVLLYIWEGDWNNPHQSRQIKLGRYFRDGHFGVIGSAYRTEEGEAYEVTHWMPLPEPPAA